MRTNEFLNVLLELSPADPVLDNIGIRYPNPNLTTEDPDSGTGHPDLDRRNWYRVPLGPSFRFLQDTGSVYP